MVSLARPSLEPLGLKVVPAHGVELAQLSDVGSYTREAVVRIMETVTFEPDLSSIDTTNLVPGARPVYTPSNLTVSYLAESKTIQLSQDGGISGVKVDVVALGGDGINDIELLEDGESMKIDSDVHGVRISWRNGAGASDGFELPVDGPDVSGEQTTDVGMSFEAPEDVGGDESGGPSGEEGSGDGGSDESGPAEYEDIEPLAKSVGGGYGLQIDELRDDIVDPLLDKFDDSDPINPPAETSDDHEFVAQVGPSFTLPEQGDVFENADLQLALRADLLGSNGIEHAQKDLSAMIEADLLEVQGEGVFAASEKTAPDEQPMHQGIPADDALDARDDAAASEDRSDAVFLAQGSAEWSRSQPVIEALAAANIARMQSEERRRKHKVGSWMAA